MDAKEGQPTTIDEYIAQCPEEVQETLQKVRAAIKAAAPQAVEGISYRMPAFFQDGTLVWFAAFKHHVGLYPTASGIEAFRDELKGYKSSKGAVQFPLDKPIPYDLISRIVKYRVAESQRKKK
jgi:uncharacterized protein YdhG (YjbR/CyaY superfamily)